uniref:Uncharacterized protein n=1 Tax=Cacopsylla melanoneura TaxID=428564 RepID=A0A8D9BSY0_9HEMI
MDLVLHKAPYHLKISKPVVNHINQSIAKISNTTPTEFARKLRGLDELKRWKATELRIFLLYIGIVVLKNSLNETQYNNFMLLTIGTRIFLDKSLQNCSTYSCWTLISIICERVFTDLWSTLGFT